MDIKREINYSGVTVVTPTVPPRAILLEDAKDSVRAQLWPAEEHIIVVDENAEGEAATRNKGLFQVKTKWTAFLDDDDIMLPNHLQLLINTAEERNIDLVYSWFYVKGGVDPLGEFGNPCNPEELRNRNFIPVTYIVRTELAQNVGGFPMPNTKEWPHDACVDWGFLIRLLDAGCRFYHVPERSWVWSHHATNTSGKLWTEVYKDK